MVFPVVAAAMAAYSAFNAVKSLNHGDVIGAGIAAVQACTGVASLGSAGASAAGTGVQGAAVTTDTVVPNLGEAVDLSTVEGQQVVESAAQTAATTGEAVMVNLGHALTGGSMVLAIGGEKQLSKLMGGAASLSHSLLSASETNVVNNALDTANIANDAEVIADTKTSTVTASASSSSTAHRQLSSNATSKTESKLAGGGALHKEQPKQTAPNRGTATMETLDRLEAQKSDISADCIRETLTPTEATVHKALQQAAVNAARAVSSNANPFTAMNSALLPRARESLLTPLSGGNVEFQAECSNYLSSMLVVDASPDAFVLQGVDANGAEHLYFVDASPNVDSTTATVASETVNCSETCSPSTTQKVTTVVLDFVPGVGTAKGVVELFMGKDAITGEPVPRWISAVGLIPLGGLIAKLGKGVVKSSAKAVSKKVSTGVLSGAVKVAEKEGATVASEALKSGEKAVAKEATSSAVSGSAKVAGTEKGILHSSQSAVVKEEASHQALQGMKTADPLKGQVQDPRSLVEKLVQESAPGNSASREIMKGKISDSRILDAGGKKMQYSTVAVERTAANELKEVKYTIHYVEAAGKYYDVKTVVREVLGNVGPLPK